MMFRNGPTMSRNEENDPSTGDERTSGASYRELLPIGSGGSANITIAMAEGLAGFSKLVVLKTIREDLTSNVAATKMFLDEARLSARMNHPNVVQVYEVFLRQGIPVIVMEFLDGQPLSAVLAQAYEQKSLTLDMSVAILIKVLAALHYAHTLTEFTGQELGLIHRDVSPHNVMLTYDGQVKLVDFGIAKLAGAQHQTRTGVIKGKLTYMAPEQFTGKVDCRADIFGVGVMLWELATQKRFWGDLPEPALIGRLISGDLPHLSKPSVIDEDLYRICCKALAFNVDGRYESAAAMQEELERYLAKRGSVVTQAALGRLVVETCGEARRKVQAAIREQMSQHGVLLTNSFDGLTPERTRAKLAGGHTLSGERVRPRPGSREASTGGLRRLAGAEPTTTGGLRRKLGTEQSTGGLRRNASAEQSSGGLRRNASAEQSSGGLRNRQGEKLTTEGGLRIETHGDLGSPGNPEGGASTDEQPASRPAPLRLFGGVAPTARVGVALAGFGTLAVLILALGLATPADPSASPAPPTPSAWTAPPAAAKRSVRINVSAQPAGASWYLDDQELDSNPIELSLPTDGALHTLRAEAAGFKPFIKSVRFDADIDITVALTPE